jgi:hypothetical protein
MTVDDAMTDMEVSRRCTPYWLPTYGEMQDLDKGYRGRRNVDLICRTMSCGGKYVMGNYICVCDR